MMQCLMVWRLFWIKDKRVSKGEWEKSWEWTSCLWHIKMEMRRRSVHQINSLIGSVKAMEVYQASLLCPHGLTSLMGWRRVCQHNQIAQSRTSQTPVRSSAECFLFSSSIPLSVTLSPRTPAPLLLIPTLSPLTFFSSSFLYLLRLLSVSVRLLTLFSMLSSLWGSSFRNLTASTSTRSTDRILVCRAGNSPEETHREALHTLLFCDFLPFLFPTLCCFVSNLLGKFQNVFTCSISP